MLNFLNIFGDHEVAAWRDHHTLLAAATLNQVAADILSGIEPEFAAAGWRDGLIGQAGFVATRIAPQVRAIAEPVALRLVQDANDALAQIVEHQAIWYSRPDGDVVATEVLEGWQDIASSAGPIAGGIAIAAALPAAAVTTTGGLLGTGLFAATVVHWPVVVGGGAIAGIAIATGALNSARIWDKAEARLRRKAREHITGALLRGSPDHPSVLEQMISLYEQTANEAKKL